MGYYHGDGLVNLLKLNFSTRHTRNMLCGSRVECWDIQYIRLQMWYHIHRLEMHDLLEMFVINRHRVIASFCNIHPRFMELKTTLL